MNQEKIKQYDFNVGELLSLLWNKLSVIILSGVLLALIAVVGVKLFITPQYESTTRMYVLTKQTSGAITNGDLQTSTMLTKDYSELVISRAVTEAVIAQMQLDMKYEQLIKKMSVNAPTDTRILSITVKDEDPYMAKKLADTIRDVASEHIQKVMDVESVNVVDEANIPENQSSPKVGVYAFIAGIIGCLIAIVIIAARFLMNDTIQTSEDIEKYLNLSMIGMIPMVEQNTKGKKKKVKYKK